MNARQHAHLARRLIDLCGGLAESADHCRVSKSSLHTYQNPNDASAFMPADVIDDLESYCGEAVYSSVLTDTVKSLTGVPDLVGAALEIGGLVNEFAAECHLSMKDGKCSLSERDRLNQQVNALRDQLSRISVELDETKTDTLEDALSLENVVTNAERGHYAAAASLEIQPRYPFKVKTGDAS